MKHRQSGFPYLKIILVLLSLFLSIFLTGCAKRSDVHGVSMDEIDAKSKELGISSAELSQWLNDSAEAENFIHELTSSLDQEKLESQPESVARSLIDQMDQSKYIKEGTTDYDDENQLITFEYADGSLGGIMLGDFPDDVNAVSASSPACASSPASASSPACAPSPASASVSASASSLSPAFSAGRAPVSGSTFSSLSASADSQPDVLLLTSFSPDDLAVRKPSYLSCYDPLPVNLTTIDNVTVSDFTQLSGWNCIIVESHGGIYNEESFICLDELVNSASDLSYYSYITDRAVARISCHSNEKEPYRTRYWIGSRFFSRGYSGDLSGTMVLLAGCGTFGKDAISTTPDNRFGLGIMKAGASAMVGFHNSVMSSYTPIFYSSIIKSMCNGESFLSAFQNAKLFVGETDYGFRQSSKGHPKDYSLEPAAYPCYLLHSNDYSFYPAGAEIPDSETSHPASSPDDSLPPASVPSTDAASHPELAAYYEILSSGAWKTGYDGQTFGYDSQSVVYYITDISGNGTYEMVIHDTKNAIFSGYAVIYTFSGDSAYILGYLSHSLSFSTVSVQHDTHTLMFDTPATGTLIDYVQVLPSGMGSPSHTSFSWDTEVVYPAEIDPSLDGIYYKPHAYDITDYNWLLTDLPMDEEYWDRRMPGASTTPQQPSAAVSSHPELALYYQHIHSGQWLTDLQRLYGSTCGVNALSIRYYLTDILGNGCYEMILYDSEALFTGNVLYYTYNPAGHIYMLGNTMDPTVGEATVSVLHEKNLLALDLYYRDYTMDYVQVLPSGTWNLFRYNTEFGPEIYPEDINPSYRGIYYKPYPYDITDYQWMLTDLPMEEECWDRRKPEESASPVAVPLEGNLVTLGPAYCTFNAPEMWATWSIIEEQETGAYTPGYYDVLYDATSDLLFHITVYQGDPDLLASFWSQRYQGTDGFVVDGEYYHLFLGEFDGGYYEAYWPVTPANQEMVYLKMYDEIYSIVQTTVVNPGLLPVWAY